MESLELVVVRLVPNDFPLSVVISEVAKKIKRTFIIKSSKMSYRSISY